MSSRENRPTDNISVNADLLVFKLNVAADKEK